MYRTPGWLTCYIISESRESFTSHSTPKQWIKSQLQTTGKLSHLFRLIYLLFILEKTFDTNRIQASSPPEPPCEWVQCTLMYSGRIQGIRHGYGVMTKIKMRRGQQIKLPWENCIPLIFLPFEEKSNFPYFLSNASSVLEKRNGPSHGNKC